VAVVVSAAAAAAGGLVGLGVSESGAASSGLPSTPLYSLPLALQESLYFYDAQRHGGCQLLSGMDDFVSAERKCRTL
jgi:hypothetical protein